MSQLASGLVTGSLINVDLTKAPNEIPLVDAGVYDCIVVDAKVEENADKTGFNLVPELKVETDGPNKGRSVRDFCGISADPKRNVRLRRFVLCAMGRIPSPLNVEEIKGKVVRVEIHHKADKKDPMKIYANIKDYIIPPEVLAANPTVD